MMKPLISHILTGVTLVTLVGCQATPAVAPMPFMPTNGTVQSATSTGYTYIHYLDPSFELARKRVADHLVRHPLKLPMSKDRAETQEKQVLAAFIYKLAARTLPSLGLTEFVTVSELNGEGTANNLFASTYHVFRTLRFTLDAKGNVKTFEDLDPDAIKRFTIAGIPFKPFDKQQHAEWQKALVRDIKSGTPPLMEYVHKAYVAALVGQPGSGTAEIASAQILTLPEGSLFRVDFTATLPSGDKRKWSWDLFQERSGHFTRILQTT